MLGEQNEKLETIKDLVGTRTAYIETVKMLELEGEEKNIFLRALLEVKKNRPNQEIIDMAYAILTGKSFQGKETREEDEDSFEYTESKAPKVDNPILITVKRTIGTSSLFMEFINKYKLSSNEKAILSLAYESLNKEPYDLDKVHSAYKIISKFTNSTENNDIDEFKDIKNKSKIKEYESVYKSCTNCGNRFSVNTRFCSKCGASFELNNQDLYGIYNDDTNQSMQQNIKPKEVKTAVKLLYISLGLGVLSFIIDTSITIQTPLSVMIVIFVFGFLWFWYFFIDKGYNWARITFLILTIMGIPFYIPISLVMLRETPAIGLISLSISLLQIVALVYLFQKSSSMWFSGGKRRRKLADFYYPEI